MNFLKLILISVVAIFIVTVSFLIMQNKNLLQTNRFSPDTNGFKEVNKTKIVENDLFSERTKKISTPPLKWFYYNSSKSIEENTKEKIEKPEEQLQRLKKSGELQESIENIGSKVKNFTDSIFQNSNRTKSEKKLLVGEYYKNFLETVSKISFNEEELFYLKKDSDKRVLLLEELIEQLISKKNIEELAPSFLAWHNLDEKVIAELNKIQTNSETLYLHNSMIDWFKYHSAISKKIADKDFSEDSLSELYRDFQKRAEIHNDNFHKSLSGISNFSKFVLIPKAKAVTCGAVIPPPFYHFGGRVLYMQPCNFGVVEAISSPCGGLLFFSYPVLAANPFLWKKPTIVSAVIGRSVLIPGVCPLGACPFCVLFPYEAIVLYFGTSLAP